MFKLQTRLCRRASSAPTCRPVKPPHLKWADLCTPSPGRVFWSTLTFTNHVWSFSHPRGFVSTFVLGVDDGRGLAEQGSAGSPWLSCRPNSPRCSPALRRAAQGSPASRPGARRGDASEEESLGPPRQPPLDLSIHTDRCPRVTLPRGISALAKITPDHHVWPWTKKQSLRYDRETSLYQGTFFSHI